MDTGEASPIGGVDPSPASYFGLQATWGVTKHMGGRKATDELAALASLGPGTRVLEVGCGTGASACHLAQQFGCQILALDNSAAMVRWARGRVAKEGLQDRVDVMVGDAHALAFDTHQFDAVICESVTAFLDKPRAVGEFARVTRPGGTVCLSEATWIQVPPPDVADYLRRGLGGAQFLDPDGWRAVLADAGLTDLELRLHSVNALEQWANEMGQLSPREYLAAWRTFAIQLSTSPAARGYLRTLWPPPASVSRLFRYFGYGIYVGRKPISA